MGSSDKLQCVIDLLSKTISSGNMPFADEINALTSELKIVVSIMLVVYTPPCCAGTASMFTCQLCCRKLFSFASIMILSI